MAVITTILSSHILEPDSRDIINTNFANLNDRPLSDLADVTITAIGAGELLKWDGAKWINNTLAEAGISPTGHTHLLSAGATDVTATAAELNLLDLAALSVGQVLRATGATTAAWGAIQDADLPAGLMRDTEHATDPHIIPGLNVDTGTLFVDAVNNRVGIGTTSPGHKLTVDSGASHNTLLVSSDVTTIDPGMFFRSTNANRTWGLLVQRNVGTFIIMDVTGESFPFEIRAGAPSYSFCILSNGNVGIKTFSPGANLHIDDPTITATKVLFQVESSVVTANTIKARIEADGEIFSDIGFTTFSPKVSDDPKIALQQALAEANKPKKPYAGFVPDEKYILEVEKAEKQQEKSLKETAKQLSDLDKKIKKEKGEKLKELQKQKKELLESQKQQQTECEKEKKHIENLKRHRVTCAKFGVKDLKTEKKIYGKNLATIAIGLAKYVSTLEKRLSKLEGRLK